MPELRFFDDTDHNINLYELLKAVRIQDIHGNLLHKIGYTLSHAKHLANALKSEIDTNDARNLERIDDILSTFASFEQSYRVNKTFYLQEYYHQPEQLVEFDIHEIITNFLKVFSYEEDRIQYIPPQVMQKFQWYGYASDLMFAIECLFQNAKDFHKDQITIEALVDTTSASIKVIDNGVGIDPLLQLFLFKKRFTTKKYGRGLGLVVARHIIEDRFKGSIRFTSFKKPTIVELSIPIHRTPELQG